MSKILCEKTFDQFNIDLDFNIILTQIAFKLISNNDEIKKNYGEELRSIAKRRFHHFFIQTIFDISKWTEVDEEMEGVVIRTYLTLFMKKHELSLECINNYVESSESGEILRSLVKYLEFRANRFPQPRFS